MLALVLLLCPLVVASVVLVFVRACIVLGCVDYAGTENVCICAGMETIDPMCERWLKCLE